MLERSSARYVLYLYVIDIIGTLAALPLARLLRLYLPYGKVLNPEGTALYWPMYVMLVVTWTLTLAMFKVYDPRRFAHTSEELQVTIPALAVATLVFAGALYFSYRGLSRLLYVYFFLVDLLIFSLARWILRRVMVKGGNNHVRATLIVGAGSSGRRVARLLAPWAWTGIQVLGYVDDDVNKTGARFEGAPVLGTLDDTVRLVGERGVSEVIVTLPMGAHKRVTNLVTEIERLPVNIKVVPDYSDIVFYRTTVEQLGDVLFVGIKEPVIGPIDRALKRVFDMCLSLTLLVLLAPVLATIALAVWLTSRGPVFYHSARIGEGGRPFRMHKFRTMVRGAEQTERELVSETDDGRLEFNKRENDPRITAVGRFLRRYSLDELPQLYNVLAGEMSLVGPRPELPSLVERYADWQRKRFGVPQGMTGWWQVSGRGNKAKYLHVEDDLNYIRSYSLLLDVRILLRTVGAVLRGDGAF